MFKKILLPLDGSELSQLAVEQCLKLAVSTSAEVLAFHVIQPLSALSGGAFMGYQMLGSISREEFEGQARAQADTFLSQVCQIAREAGVSCTSQHTISDQPHAAIILASENNSCDLVFMASHGRRGIEGLLLGSETQKVLIHSKVPVLVYR